MKKNVILTLLVLGIFVAPGLSQEVTGNLEGRVLDSQGEPLPAVNIIVAGPNLQGLRGAASDEYGYFRVQALPVGTYTVRISHIGYDPVRFEDVGIRLGRTVTLPEIRLEARAIELPEISIAGKRPLIDPSSAAVETNLLPETFSTLPVDRNFRSILTLASQVNASTYPGDEANIAGSSGPENIYYVDGINVTDPNRGATSTNLPYNFVKEIEIKSGGYEAEYGRALGGIANVVTYSGGNEFHGQLFGFFTNQWLAGASRRGTVDANVGDFSQYDIGFSVGGPIERDRLWFFLAYNPTFEDRQIEMPGVGFRTDSRRSQLFAGKLTWQAGANTDFVFTILGDPSIRHGIGQAIPVFGEPYKLTNADPVLGLWEEGGINLSFRVRHRVGERVLIEASAARFARSQDNRGDADRGSAEPTVVDLQTGIWSGGYGVFNKDHSVRSSASASLLVFLATHAFKAGLEYEDNFLDDHFGVGGRDFGGGGFLFRANDTTYSWFLAGSDGKVHNRVPSAYVQDSWQVTERLRLNAGLRWDGQFLVATDGSVAQRITNQFQPRVGITYQPGELGSQKFFASYGRFYEQLGTYLSTVIGGRGENTFVSYNHNPLVNPSGGDTTLSNITGIRPEVPGLQGEDFDEFIVGYERLLWGELKVGIRGIYRTLREVIDDGFDPVSGNGGVGNLGRGALSWTGPPKRDYTALEFTVENSRGESFQFLASYVLSRNYGNYTGVYSTELNVAGNAGPQFDNPELLPNNTGLLPNDRTHVFKFIGSYRYSPRLTIGVSANWQSGTPLSELGGVSVGPPYSSFVRPRGSAGRTPAIWDLNLRLSYDLGDVVGTNLSPKVLIDIFRVGSPREALTFDQVHYGALDANGNQTALNLNYGKATHYQPPMSLRLGLEVNF